MKIIVTLFLLAVLNFQFAYAQWTSSGTNLYTTNTAQKVGIGTQTPSAKLHIIGGDLIQSGDIPSSNSAQFFNTSATGYGFYSQGGGGGRYALHFLNKEGNTIVYGKGSGEVGIGTINPGAKLHIAGNMIQNGDMPESNSAQFFNTSATGYGFYSQGGGGGRYAFHFLNKEGNTIMYGKGTGQVGIGTSDTYDYMLAVKGKMIAEEVVVKVFTSWPDYVFEPSYKLPTLSELEKFIVQYKHLPGVPSASEVKENGVSLGEMNAILLKKLEETTLHLIQANKTVEKLVIETKDSQTEIEALKLQMLELATKIETLTR